MDIQTIITATLAASPGAQTPARAKSATELPSTQEVEKNAAPEPPASRAQLLSAVNAANDFVKPINSAVQFSLDNDSGQTIVKVMDSTTNEVIRQIPSEEMVAIAKALDQIQGLLIKQKA